MNYKYHWRGVTILIVDATEEQARTIGNLLVKHLPNEQLHLPKPVTHRICVRCWNQIDVRKGNYTVINGDAVHVKCPPLHDFDP